MEQRIISTITENQHLLPPSIYYTTEINMSYYISHKRINVNCQIA